MHIHHHHDLQNQVQYFPCFPVYQPEPLQSTNVAWMPHINTSSGIPRGSGGQQQCTLHNILMRGVRRFIHSYINSSGPPLFLLGTFDCCASFGSVSLPEDFIYGIKVDFSDLLGTRHVLWETVHFSVVSAMKCVAGNGGSLINTSGYCHFVNPDYRTVLFGPTHSSKPAVSAMPTADLCCHGRFG